MTQTYAVTVNGTRHQIAADRDATLLHILRNELGLVGSRFGCGLGLCGACFVIMDGAAVPACDMPIWSVDGKSITTIEGLSDGDRLHPVQTAILSHQAAQCGFCISGIIVNAASILESNPDASESDIVAALDATSAAAACSGASSMQSSTRRASRHDRTPRNPTAEDASFQSDPQYLDHRRLR